MMLTTRAQVQPQLMHTSVHNSATPATTDAVLSIPLLSTDEMLASQQDSDSERDAYVSEMTSRATSRALDTPIISSSLLSAPVQAQPSKNGLVDTIQADEDNFIDDEVESFDMKSIELTDLYANFEKNKSVIAGLSTTKLAEHNTVITNQGKVIGYSTRKITRPKAPIQAFSATHVTNLVNTVVEERFRKHEKDLQHLRGNFITMREQLNGIMRAFRSTTNGTHQADIELFTSRERDDYGNFLNDEMHKAVYDKFFTYPVNRDGIIYHEYAFECVPQENSGEGKKASRNEPSVLLSFCNKMALDGVSPLALPASVNDQLVREHLPWYLWMHKPRNEQVYCVKTDEEASRHPQLLHDFLRLFKLRREKEQKRLSTYNPIYAHIQDTVSKVLAQDTSKQKTTNEMK